MQNQKKNKDVNKYGKEESKEETKVNVKEESKKEREIEKVNVKVSIVMGSDSDLKVMKQGADLLNEFNIPFEIKIVSAHRTPDLMFKFAKNCSSRNVKVIIAGAGGAAHLPGMIASLTHLPVIGVPVKTTALSGVDSLYSICQMPKGVPVATVAINNSYNAGLLATRILALEDTDINEKICMFMKNQTENVEQKINHWDTIFNKNNYDYTSSINEISNL